MPNLPPPVLETPSADEDDEPSLSNMMTIFMDISLMLSSNEKKVETVAAHADDRTKPLLWLHQVL